MVKGLSAVVFQPGSRAPVAFGLLSLGVVLALFLVYSLYSQNAGLRGELSKASELLAGAVSDASFLRSQVSSLQKENEELKKQSAEASAVAAAGAVTVVEKKKVLELGALNSFLGEQGILGNHSGLLNELSVLSETASPGVKEKVSALSAALIAFDAVAANYSSLSAKYDRAAKDLYDGFNCDKYFSGYYTGGSVTVTGPCYVPFADYFAYSRPFVSLLKDIAEKRAKALSAAADLLKSLSS